MKKDVISERWLYLSLVYIGALKAFGSLGEFNEFIENNFEGDAYEEMIALFIELSVMFG